MFYRDFTAFNTLKSTSRLTKSINWVRPAPELTSLLQPSEFTQLWTYDVNSKFILYTIAHTYLPGIPPTFPVNMPLVASTGHVLARCWQHRTSTGPVLAHNGMLLYPGVSSATFIHASNIVCLYLFGEDRLPGISQCSIRGFTEIGSNEHLTYLLWSNISLVKLCQITWLHLLSTDYATTSINFSSQPTLVITYNFLIHLIRSVKNVGIVDICTSLYV